MTTNTCDACANYKPGTSLATGAPSMFGECALIGDFLKVGLAEDRVSAYEDSGNGFTSAGAFVGPKFGCIHWTAKS